MLIRVLRRKRDNPTAYTKQWEPGKRTVTQMKVITMNKIVINLLTNTPKAIKTEQMAYLISMDQQRWPLLCSRRLESANGLMYANNRQFSTRQTDDESVDLIEKSLSKVVAISQSSKANESAYFVTNMPRTSKKTTLRKMLPPMVCKSPIGINRLTTSRTSQMEETSSRSSLHAHI